MRSQSTPAVLQVCHDLRDRNDGGIARQNRLRWCNRLDVRENPLFDGEILGTCFEYEVSVRDRFSNARMTADVADRSHILVQIAQVTADSRLECRQNFRGGILHTDPVSGSCEHLSDTVTHEAPAHHGNACEPGHPSTRRVAAVGIENMSGVEVRGFGREEQQRTGEIFGFPESTQRYAGQYPLAHGVGLLIVFEHPRSQR